MILSLLSSQRFRDAIAQCSLVAFVLFVCAALAFGDAPPPNVNKPGVDTGVQVKISQNAVGIVPIGKTVSVSNSSTALLSANGARRGFLIVNNGSTAVYVTLGATAVSGASAATGGGFYLAQGGVFASSYFGIYTGAIAAITASSTTVVHVSEW